MPTILTDDGRVKTVDELEYRQHCFDDANNPRLREFTDEGEEQFQDMQVIDLSQHSSRFEVLIRHLVSSN